MSDVTRLERVEGATEVFMQVFVSSAADERLSVIDVLIGIHADLLNKEALKIKITSSITAEEARRG